MMAFAKCVEGNMDALGMPTPTHIWTSIGLITTAAGTLANAVATYGTKVTIQDLAGATFLAGKTAQGIKEISGVVGAVTVSFYLGCLTGAIIACTIDKFAFPDFRTSPVPMTAALYQLRKHKIELSDDMIAMMNLNPEMVGVAPDPTFQSRLKYYGTGDGSGMGDSNTAFA